MQNPTIVFEKPRQVELQERAQPRPRAGELLIRTTATLISAGTELTILSGNFPAKSVWARYGSYPFVAGYSNVGVVQEAGEGVDRTWVGRRVATRTPHAAWVTAPQASAAAVPDGIPDEPAALFAIATIVMNGVRRARLAWGEAVVVFGLGLLGQFAVRFAERAGARPIVAVDVADARLGLLPKKPVVLPVNPESADVRAAVREANHGRLADVVFEVTGDPELIAGEFAALKRQGRFVVLSSPRGPTSFDFHDLCNAPSFTIIGSHETSHPAAETPENPWTHGRHYELFFDYVKEGAIDTGSLISHRVKPAQAPEIYHQLLAGPAAFMGVVIDWRDAASAVPTC